MQNKQLRIGRMGKSSRIYPRMVTIRVPRFCFHVVCASLICPAHAEVYRFVTSSGETYYSQQTIQKRSIKEFIDGRRIALPAPRPSHNAPSAYESWIGAAARQHNLDPKLIHAVIQAESGYNPFAVSDKGAQGLMQLMPATAARFGVDDPLDVSSNINGGSRYLRVLLNQFDSDLELALAAYNAGEKNVMRYGRKIPPFAETKNYVNRVIELYRAP